MSRTARPLLRLACRLAAPLATIAACAAPEPDAPATPAPTLAQVDSVVLADTGALTLGSLVHAGLHVGDDAVWIGDPQNGRVVRFARDGRALGTAGRKGQGPGEIEATGPLVPLGDGTIAVWDYMAGKLLAYDGRDGAFRWETPIREQAFPVQLQAVGDTLWFGVVSLTDSTGAMRLVARQGTVTKHASYPAEYAAGLAYSFPYSVALRFGDTLLVGYSGHHRVFLHHDGGRVDSLVVPARRRRGVPPDLLEQLQARRGRPGADVGPENLVSSLMRGARLSDGSFALVHYDVEFDGREAAKVDAWLTVLDPSFTRACVDAPLPLSERALPSLAFRGDTLFVLEHVIDEVQALPMLRAYAIATAGCAWMAVERG
jgi:hypothetical protein